MSTQKTQPTNGATNGKPKVETNVSVLNNTKPGETKPDAKVLQLPPSTTSQQKEESKLPSLDDRFYKLDTLFALREKHEKMKETLDKLNKFKLSSEGRNDNITLKDDKGNTFTTGNPDVLTKVVEWLKEDLNQKLKTVDSQIRF